jgi:HEAT repeat protein
MNDDQWLSAMAKHSTERTDWDKFTGSASELSQLLKQEVVKDPLRFARLALRITTNTHPAYAEMILIGLGEAEALDDPSVVFDAIRHIAALGQEPSDRWLGQAARKYLKVVPSDIIDIVADRAANAIDPTRGDDSGVYGQGGREHRGGEELYIAGLNTARGAAAEVLGDILVYDTDGSRTAQVLPLLSRMAEDPVVSVRAFVAHVIHACMRYARPQALAAFEQLIDTDDLLLATHSVGRLIAHIGYGEPGIVTPVIQRMLDSAVFETREVGGQLATVAAIGWNLPDMLASVVDGADLASRRGAARSCAQSLLSTSDRIIASHALTQFVNDQDEDVRKAAAEMAATLRGERLRPFSEVLLALMASAAFVVALPQLLITLEQAPDRVDDLVLECAHRFIETLGIDAADLRTGTTGESREIGELLVRAYAQATLPTDRSKILDILDRLLEIGAYGVANVIAESER